MVQSPFISYSQNGEDILLWRALKDVQCGFYIDVGAQDPVVDSVTKAFYERGWHGINIEPVMHWHKRLVQDRPHDINLPLAVSHQPGAIQLFEVEGTGLSTVDPEFAHRHETEGYTIQERIVECATLNQICADNAVRTVHFLKIDCEGAEKSALEGISLSEVRPWIVLVEATEPNSTTPTWHDWEHLLTERGYQFAFFDGLNRFYLAEEHMDLASAFESPVNVFDTIGGVRRIAEVNAQELVGRLHGEVDELRAARDAALTERDAVTAARDAALAERDAVMADRDALIASRHAVALERDRLITERDALTVERDALTAERDDLRVRHTALQHENAERKREVGRLQANLAELLSSHSWRVTAPLRACSRTARRMYRGLRRAVYLAMRPLARLARPLLRRLAHWTSARKLVVGVFGRRSRLVNTARLFLIGAPAPEVERDPPPEPVSEENSLSARGRDVLSVLEAMRTKEKGESERARRT